MISGGDIHVDAWEGVAIRVKAEIQAEIDRVSPNVPRGDGYLLALENVLEWFGQAEEWEEVEEAGQ